MTATLLVEIETDDISTILDEAEEIHIILEYQGFPVLSVKPWARPTQPTILPAPTQFPRS